MDRKAERKIRNRCLRALKVKERDMVDWRDIAVMWKCITEHKIIVSPLFRQRMAREMRQAPEGRIWR